MSAVRFEKAGQMNSLGIFMKLTGSVHEDDPNGTLHSTSLSASQVVRLI